MRENSKVSGNFELSLDARKVAGVLLGSLVLLGLAFALGSSYGAKAVHAPAGAASKDPLARLDEPMAAPPREDESLRAHEALTASRAEALPVVKPVALAPRSPASPFPDTIPLDGEGEPKAAPPTSTATSSLAVTPPLTPAPTTYRPLTPAPAPSRKLPRIATTTPPRPIAAKPKVAAAQHGFTIQLASVAHRAEAEKVAHRYKGRHPRVVAADVPGKGRVWRVQVGSYPTREAASRSLAALGARGYITAMR